MKKKRSTRACDECAKRKVKCNGEELCESCRKSNRICQYSKPIKKRGPSSNAVHEMMDRIEELESLLHKNGIDVNRDFDEASEKDDGEIQVENISISNTIIPSNSVQSYTIQKFLNLTVPSHGKQVIWWQVYFEKINSKYPFYTQEWFESNLSSIPIFVLHIMYAATVTYPECQFKSAVEGDLHLEACLYQIGDFHESPTLWTTQAMILVAIYSVINFRIRSGMSYLALVIRMAQTLGLDVDSDLYLDDSRMKTLEMKAFGRTLWSSINSLDYYCYFLCGVDFMILGKNTEILPEWCRAMQDVYTDPNSYFILTRHMTFCANVTYLTTIGRNVTLAKRSSIVSGNGLDFQAAKKKIDLQLCQWFVRFTKQYPIQIPTDIPSLTRYTSKMNLLSIYYFIRLSIIKPHFLEISRSKIQTAQGQLIVQETKEFLNGFGAILINLSLHNPQLTNMSIFFKHCIVTCAGFHCILLSFCDVASQLHSSGAIAEHIKALESFSRIFGTARLDIEMITHWVKDPSGAYLFLERT